MLYALVDGRTNEPSKEDGSFYHFLRNGNYIFGGIGSEFAVVSSPTSFMLNLGTGEGVICGRHVKEKALNNATSSLTLPSNSSGYVVIRFSNENAEFTYTSTIANDDINVGGSCDLVLYGYSTGASGVTTWIDMRPITNGNSYFLTMENGILYANTMNGKKKIATREI